LFWSTHPLLFFSTGFGTTHNYFHFCFNNNHHAISGCMFSKFPMKNQFIGQFCPSFESSHKVWLLLQQTKIN
jgi:hypothetical protein